MPTKPVLALLDKTLWPCRINGTKAGESGLVVSTEVLRGEIIHFYNIDSVEGRRRLAMQHDGVKICDYLVFYTKNTNIKEIICFLELKGRKIDKATKQALSTLQHFSSLFPDIERWKRNGQLSCKVYICLHGHAPSGRQRYEDQLKAAFGKGNVCIKHIIKHDQSSFGDFLRERAG